MSSCTARVGVLGSQLFRAAGNTDTGFFDLISGLVGVPPKSVFPSECLFGRFQLDFGFWLKM